MVVVRFVQASPMANTRDYNGYVAAQLGKTDHLASDGGVIQAQWVLEPHIAQISEYLTARFPPSTGFALCHGTRAGREQVWFRKHLATFREQVWGTELSSTVAKTVP